MITFTTEDRINASPPHIVDSGASVMDELTEAGHIIGVLREQICQQQAEISLLQEYVCQLEEGLNSSINLNKAQAERNNEPVIWTACLDCGKRVTGDSIHTCSPQLRQLTDEEIIACIDEIEPDRADMIRFAKAILRKAQEK